MARVIPVVDLFSGAGGMSFGFHAHPRFRLLGAADVEVGKPSTGHGALQCNSTYEANIGLPPVALDLSTATPGEVFDAMGLNAPPEVLLACPPCTGFSRVNASNHLRDDPRNGLVRRVADYVAAWQPKVLLMENARELLTGKFTDHFRVLRSDLESLGYTVTGEVHMLTRFGVPQQRERALVIATAPGVPHHTMDELWEGRRVDPKASHVRRAIWDLDEVEAGATHPDDPNHTSTLLRGESLERIRAIPRNGGSWVDLLRSKETRRYLIPAMERTVERGRLNQFCDVYGRMAWDRPAPTIKRECCHPGNGRYSHPEQDRMCTVRELAILQGFPASYRFVSTSRKNTYRHIGDAVPPIVSYQLARLTGWILGGRRPTAEELVLPGTHLRPDDIESVT